MTDKDKSIIQIFKDSGNKALGGGFSGAMAMGVNVLALMWLRTTINYQYRFGTSTTTAFKIIYSQGGVLRFYSGLGPALIQGPLSRFGDTAANDGTLHLLNSFDLTKDLPIGFKTVFASISAGLFRILLMPVDTLKTIMQVEGKQGIPILMTKLKMGPQVLYYGSIATASATFVGHYPWFFTYNFLQQKLPKYNDKLKNLSRNAFIGFMSSLISDCCSNSLRVIKVYKQTNQNQVSYLQAGKNIIESDGLIGLFGRGLKTKILANGMQGILFSVLWNYFKDLQNKRNNKE